MVAIVVILAAVIAAFVFGMVGGTTASKNVGLTVSPGTSAGANVGITVLWQGGSDMNSLLDVTETVDGAVDGQIISGGWPATGASADHPEVGEITELGQQDVTGTRVVLVGTFTDGTSQVIFDRRY